MISVTYILIIIKGLSLDDEYIIWTIILYKGLTIVRSLEFIQNECKENKRLDLLINILIIESVHVNQNLFIMFWLRSSHDCLMINKF